MYLAYFWAILLIVFDWLPPFSSTNQRAFLVTEATLITMSTPEFTAECNSELHYYFQTFSTSGCFLDFECILVLLWCTISLFSLGSKPFPHLRICLLFKLNTLKLPIPKFNNLPYAFSLLFLFFKEIWPAHNSDYWG